VTPREYGELAVNYKPCVRSGFSLSPKDPIRSMFWLGGSKTQANQDPAQGRRDGGDVD